MAKATSHPFISIEKRMKRINEVKATWLGRELFMIHTHAEIAYKVSRDQIVYREADVINLLVKLGHPKPVFDGKVFSEEVVFEKPKKKK